jgi:hypothetical protein
MTTAKSCTIKSVGPSPGAKNCGKKDGSGPRCGSPHYLMGAAHKNKLVASGSSLTKLIIQTNPFKKGVAPIFLFF